MFDLPETDNIKARGATAINTSNGNSIVAGTTLYYQSTEIKNALLEVSHFEGWSVPNCIKGMPDVKTTKSDTNNIIIVDLTSSDELLQDIKQYNSKIPNTKAVIVIGKIDTIKTLKSLEQMGFYYLLWPFDKADLSACLKQATQQSGHLFNSDYYRKAKRISVIGTRGGIGTSLISAELAHNLVKDGSRVTLVDHQYQHGNMDIILNKNKLNKINIGTITIDIHQLDEESAVRYLVELEHNYFYLGVNGDPNTQRLKSYSEAITSKLLRQNNFIVEDYSASVDFALDVKQIVNDSDIIVVVVDCSITSVRNGTAIIDEIKELSLSKLYSPRILVVINNHRTKESYNLTRTDVEKHLNLTVDAEIPYYKQVSQHLVKGTRISSLAKGNQKPLQQLTASITGNLNLDNTFLARMKRRLKWR